MIIQITACNGWVSEAGGSLKVGDTVTLGQLDWVVLAMDGGKALLLSVEILETRAFDSTSNNWENSEIRAYLNGSFFNSTFNNQEKSKIVETELTTTNQNRTNDRVFLLSADESKEYVSGYVHRNIRRIRNAEYTGTGNTSIWWLRSSGSRPCRAAYAFSDGRASDFGDGVDITDVGVRPAMWFNP